MYLEASGKETGDRATLLSPSFESTSIVVFAFWYHMYGSGMGSLTLEATEDGTVWVPLWTRTGEAGNV